MNFLDKMERKYGRYALSHLTMYIIVTYIAGYIIQLAAPIMRQYLTLEPYYILHGQIWRLLSWILIPPSSLDIFTIIMLFFYYSIGTSLERAWGDFKYNVYIFSGILMTIIGSFLLYGILYAVNGYPSLMGTAFSTYYISLSIFLGFAISFPDMQVLFMMVLPLKASWIAVAEAGIYIYSFITGGLIEKIEIVLSLILTPIVGLIAALTSPKLPHGGEKWGFVHIGFMVLTALALISFLVVLFTGGIFFVAGGE